MQLNVFDFLYLIGINGDDSFWIEAEVTFRSTRPLDTLWQRHG